MTDPTTPARVEQRHRDAAKPVKVMQDDINAAHRFTVDDEGCSLTAAEERCLAEHFAYARLHHSGQVARGDVERSDSDFAWSVPRHPTDAMMRSGLYHCSADMQWEDLFTAWHYMVDEAQQDDAALPAPPSGQVGTQEVERLREAMEAIRKEAGHGSAMASGAIKRIRTLAVNALDAAIARASAEQ